jgi:hypothetical protein
MVDTATGYPLHPQEDVETPPGADSSAQHYAEAYQPPNQLNTPPPAAPSQPVNPNIPGAESGFFPGYSKPIPEDIVVEWQAMSRPFKKRTRQYFTTVAVIVLLISMILFFAGQFLPIAVVVSVAFLAYVLSVVPPGMVNHSITTFGIRVEGKLYYWDELGRFWFTDKFGEKLLHIEVARFPGRITLLLGDISEADMTELLSEVLINQKPAPTVLDKAAEWIQEKIPLENDKPPLQ